MISAIIKIELLLVALVVSVFGYAAKVATITPDDASGIGDLVTTVGFPGAVILLLMFMFFWVLNKTLPAVIELMKAKGEESRVNAEAVREFTANSRVMTQELKELNLLHKNPDSIFSSRASERAIGEIAGGKIEETDNAEAKSHYLRAQEIIRDKQSR